MKRVLVLVAVLGLWCLPLMAGEFLMNDSGETATALRVTFSEPVTITGFGDTLMQVSPSGESTAFTFSGGVLEPWGTHWLNWEPKTASLKDVEWLTQSPVLAVLSQDIHTPESHIERVTYTATFTELKDDSVSVVATVTRSRSVETIPFSVEYELGFEKPVTLVSVVNDPGLLDHPGGPLVPTLLVDDFSNPALASTLGSEWQLSKDLVERFVPEICRNVNGYFLGLNAGGRATLSLDHADLSKAEGLYILASGGDWLTPFRVSVGGISYRRSFTKKGSALLLPNNDTQLYTLPFEGFEGLVEDAANGPPELEIWIEGRHSQYQGMQIYQVGLYKSLDALTTEEPATSHTTSRTFMANSVSYDVCHVAMGETGQRYRYCENLDFPLHQATRILLDETAMPVVQDDLGRTWSLFDGDPADQSFRVEPGADEGGKSFLVSDWPNALDLRYGSPASAGGGSPVVYALIHWRDGCPLERRGFDTPNLHVGTDDARGVAARLLELGRDLGFNTVKLKVKWLYGWPDDDGNFTLRLITCSGEPGDCPPTGWALSDEELELAANLASLLGYEIHLKLLQDARKDDRQLSREYAGFGSHGDACFKCTDGFLFGEGEGYWAQLAHYSRLVTDLPIDVVLLAAEADAVLGQGGAQLQEFYRDAISLYHEAGYEGLLSYAICDYSNDCCFSYGNLHTRTEALDPATCGVPFGDLGLVGVNEYQILASSSTASTFEMYQNARSRIDGFIQDLRDAYGVPVLISDLVVQAYDSVAMYPPGQSAERLQNPRDDEEQRRYYVAWLRALSEAAVRNPDLLYGVTIGSFNMSMPDQAMLVSEADFQKWESLNIKARLQDTFRVYLRDISVDGEG